MIASLSSREYSSNSLQGGSVILETLIAILIFSFAILGLIGVQGTMIGQSSDAKFRADAAYLANQIIGQMWVDRANLAAYAHNPTGATVCAPTAAASANTNVTAWIAAVAAALPGATSAKQQITVTAGASSTTVKVTVCWKRPQETSTRSFVTTAQIYN